MDILWLFNGCTGELGIGFVPYSPINRGFLGGTLNEYTVFDVNMIPMSGFSWSGMP